MSGTEATITESHPDSGGNFETELDGVVRQVWLNDVPLAAIIDEGGYNFSEVYGLNPEKEGGIPASEAEGFNWFNGVGLEDGSGAVLYIEHPTDYSKGLGFGRPHWHVNYFLEGRAEAPSGYSQEQFEDVLNTGNNLLEDIEEAEEERAEELWDRWADETNYREKGILGRFWTRIGSRGPKGLGPKNVGSYACIDDLEGFGLSVQQLVEIDERI